jgi:hypothetical protein
MTAMKIKSQGLVGMPRVGRNALVRQGNASITLHEVRTLLMGRNLKAREIQMMRQPSLTMLSRCKMLLVLSVLVCLASGVQAQQGCDNCTCVGQWQTELVPPNPETTLVDSTEHSGEHRYCVSVLIPPLCLDGFEGIRVTGSGCENLD